MMSERGTNAQRSTPRVEIVGWTMFPEKLCPGYDEPNLDLAFSGAVLRILTWLHQLDITQPHGRALVYLL